VDSTWLDAGLTMMGNAIREKTGEEDLLEFPDGLATGIGRVYEAGFATGAEESYAVGWNAGYDLGILEEKRRCLEKHFATTVIGDGSTSLSVKVPFEPDAVLVCSFDSKVRSANNNLLTWTADLRSFGMLASRYSFISTAWGGLAASANTPSTLRNYYSRLDDGTITVANVNGSGGTCTFAKDCVYVVVAAKYTDQTDKERITAFV